MPINVEFSKMPGAYLPQDDWSRVPDLNWSDIHVWKVCLDQPDDRIAQYWQHLLADERDRANRYIAKQHSSRYIIGRAVLRRLLGGYLHIRPELVSLAYSTYGKPSIETAQNPDDIRFNLTHSNNLALYAFSVGREIGIDLEWIHPIPDFDRIAAKSFSASEYRLWTELPEAEKELGFYLCWTRKEAFIKAIGNGLSFPLGQFEVSFYPGEPAQLLRVRTEPAATDQWLFRELPPIPGYAAAIVAEGGGWKLNCFKFL